MNPFTRMTSRVMQDHLILGPDASNVEILRQRLHNDSRMEGYFRALERHKAECALCSHPRLYIFGRYISRNLRRVAFKRISFGAVRLKVKRLT